MIPGNGRFLSTPSARRATTADADLIAANAISIHALREEGDIDGVEVMDDVKIFLSTPSARRATTNKAFNKAVLEFLSTPSARRATLLGILFGVQIIISIHALREEGDPAGEGGRLPGSDFYPRPPRGGRRRLFRCPSCTSDFYPRPPRGGRRPRRPDLLRSGRFLSTPSARRATPRSHAGTLHHAISIHALREEGDRFARLMVQTVGLFLSTPSARRATLGVNHIKPLLVISIHALREEGDSWHSGSGCPTKDFYPRPPRGGRPQIRDNLTNDMQFLSTPSARRATTFESVDLSGVGISIHALREEGDRRCHSL